MMVLVLYKERPYSVLDRQQGKDKDNNGNTGHPRDRELLGVEGRLFLRILKKKDKITLYQPSVGTDLQFVPTEGLNSQVCTN